MDGWMDGWMRVRVRERVGWLLWNRQSALGPEPHW